MTRVLSVQSIIRSRYVPQRGHVQVLVHLPDRRKCATLKRSSICRIGSREVHRGGRALRSLAIDPAAARAALLSILPLPRHHRPARPSESPAQRELKPADFSLFAILGPMKKPKRRRTPAIRCGIAGRVFGAARIFGRVGRGATTLPDRWPQMETSHSRVLSWRTLEIVESGGCSRG
jgi:hypothetical protein